MLQGRRKPCYPQIEDGLSQGFPSIRKVVNTAYNTVQLIQGNRRNNATFQSASISEERLKALSEKLRPWWPKGFSRKTLSKNISGCFRLGRRMRRRKSWSGSVRNRISRIRRRRLRRYRFAIMRQDFDRALAIRAEFSAARQKAHAPSGRTRRFGSWPCFRREAHREKRLRSARGGVSCSEPGWAPHVWRFLEAAISMASISKRRLSSVHADAHCGS